MTVPAQGEPGQVYRAFMSQDEINQALAAWVLNRRQVQWNGTVGVQTLVTCGKDNKVLQTRVEVTLAQAKPVY